MAITLALPTATFTQAQEFHVHDIKTRQNVLTLRWSSPDSNQVYALQERNSLDSGKWQNVSSRYGWPLAVNQWTVNREPGEMHFYRVVAEPVTHAERGRLLQSQLLRTFSVPDAKNKLANAQLGTLPQSNVEHEVQLYRVIYETVDAFGAKTQASGGLFLPKDHAGPLPLLSDQHGTETFEEWVPSQNDSFFFPEGVYFASDGYAVFMPDYLGLGESPGYHPYLHAKTEATSIVDGLRAARAFCEDNEIALNNQLFLMGYSQGGHATVAAHREIEMFHNDEFTVTACAPMAGPYDLTESVRHVLTNPDYPYPAFVAIILAAWLPIYDWDTTLEEMLAEPYDTTLTRKLTRKHKFQEIHDAMAPTFLRALDLDLGSALMEDPEHFIWEAMADNDLLDWAPQAPVRLYHCQGDEQVPYQNALTAQEAWTANGACCVEVEDPGAWLDHWRCRPRSFVSAKAWFDGFR